MSGFLLKILASVALTLGGLSIAGLASAANITCTFTDSSTGRCNAIYPLPNNCQVRNENLMGDQVQMNCDGYPNGYACSVSGNAVSGSSSVYSCVESSTQTQTTNTSGSGTSAPTPSNGLLSYTPLEPLPGVNQTGQANFAQMINGFFRILITIGAFVAVTVLVIGGIAYMFSEAWISKTIARDRVKAGLVGLAILGAAYILLRTINPQLVSFNSNLLNATPNTTQNTAGQPGSGSGNASESQITVNTAGGITIHNDLSPAQKQKAIADFLKKCANGKVEWSSGSDSGGPYTEYTCIKQ